MSILCAKCDIEYSIDDLREYDKIVICKCGHENEICACGRDFAYEGDSGFYGCVECWKEADPTAKRRALQKSFDQDLTGQDQEAYYQESY